jgi:hypothetical protein
MRHDKWARLFVVGAGFIVPLAAATLPAQSEKPAGKAARPAARAMPRRVAAVDNSAGAPKVTQSSTAQNSVARVDPRLIAAQVDQLIAAELKKTGAAVAPRCSDEDFLRRVSFDIGGVSPSPHEMTLFGLDPDSQKRQGAVERLLTSDEYTQHWARYWRDVIQSRATETRPQFLNLVLQNFESWMTKELAANRTWDQIAESLLTATGDITEAGQTAFIIAQRAEPDEVAAETSRVFLGIQLQCANCHDHPTDSWKREQFHSLAAFFPRMQARPKPGTDPMRQSLELASLTVDARGQGRGGDFFRRMQERPEEFIRRLDKNGDQKISKDESSQGAGGGQLFARLFDVGDTNKDGLLSADEIRKIPPPPMQPGRGTPEYHMPDLQHPQSAGKQLDPVFFLGNLKAGTGLSDLDRRRSLSHYITATTNPWFGKAFVNRIWGQLVGEGFYMPIDDIGPERAANHPQALEALSAGFTSSGYDIAWLFRAITATETYQRQIRPRDPKHSAVFASAAPVRLRADQLYDALAQVLGYKGQEPRPAEGDMMMMYRPNNSPRGQFQQLFGFDPSTPPDEINGTIPQALYMMNSPGINNLIRSAGKTRLNQILGKYKNDDDALTELFIVVHAREPSAKEQQTCREYIAQVNNREEAFEDILWSLLNSTEFQTKR